MGRRQSATAVLEIDPAFVEWIQSPIVYAELGSFAKRVRGLLPHVYSCLKGLHHYRSMAKTNYRGYLKAEVVPLKKYFYVLRPVLAARWLEERPSGATGAQQCSTVAQ
jgi:uncharacterized protein